jgi:hypothetical protein
LIYKIDEASATRAGGWQIPIEVNRVSHPSADLKASQGAFEPICPAL